VLRKRQRTEERARRRSSGNIRRNRWLRRQSSDECRSQTCRSQFTEHFSKTPFRASNAVQQLVVELAGISSILVIISGA
jgi:hypothetical protein